MTPRSVATVGCHQAVLLFCAHNIVQGSNLTVPQYDVSRAVKPNGANLWQNVKEFRTEQFEALTLWPKWLSGKYADQLIHFNCVTRLKFCVSLQLYWRHVQMEPPITCTAWLPATETGECVCVCVCKYVCMPRFQIWHNCIMSFIYGGAPCFVFFKTLQ